MKQVEREKYYKKDNEGFMIYLLSRLYNDLQINTALFNSVKDENNILSCNAEIYLFKILISHVKEGLKILGTMKRSTKYSGIIESWKNSNEIVKKIFDDISNEMENPTDYPDTTNAKYLNVRNEVFHYCIENKDIKYYEECQEQMCKENLKVAIECDKNEKYQYEIGVDVPITKDVFSNTAIEEVTNLKNKMLVLLCEILTGYSKSK